MLICLSFRDISMHYFVVVVAMKAILRQSGLGGEAKVKVDIRIANLIHRDNVLRFNTHLRSRIRVFFTPHTFPKFVSPTACARA